MALGIAAVAILASADLRRAAQAAAVGQRATARSTLREPSGQHGTVPSDDDERDVSRLARRDEDAGRPSAAWSGDRLTVTGTADPERLTVGEITPSLLPLLGASPLLGRGFLPGEEDEGRPAIAILSHGLWQRRFGGRPDVVGSALHLDGTSYTIVGVMPASFAFPDHETQAWIPMAIRPVTSPSHPGTSSLSLFQAIGRLAPGATPAQAATEGTTRGRTLPNTSPVTMAVFGSNGPVEVTVVPLLDALTGDVKPAILLMLAAVGLLLVVATANVANLQLARAAVRRRELAIRSALGAGSGRLARQCLIENLLLGLLGGGAGLALAARAARGAAVAAACGLSTPRGRRVRRTSAALYDGRRPRDGRRIRPAARDPGIAGESRSSADRRCAGACWREHAIPYVSHARDDHGDAGRTRERAAGRRRPADPQLHRAARHRRRVRPPQRAHGSPLSAGRRVHA